LYHQLLRCSGYLLISCPISVIPRTQVASRSLARSGTWGTIHRVYPEMHVQCSLGPPPWEGPRKEGKSESTSRTSGLLHFRDARLQRLPPLQMLWDLPQTSPRQHSRSQRSTELRQAFGRLLLRSMLDVPPFLPACCRASAEAG
jgi:hypothetical protein